MKTFTTYYRKNKDIYIFVKLEAYKTDGRFYVENFEKQQLSFLFVLKSEHLL